MAAVIGALRVDLGANTAQFVQGMSRAQAQARRTGQDIRRSFSEASRGTTSAFQEMNRSANSIRNTLRNVAGAIAASFTARELITLTDTFTRFQNSLRVAGIEGADLARVQDALFASAQRYGVELETLGQLFSRATQAASVLGASQRDLLTFTDNIAAAVRVQGGSVEQASGALLQLAQALQSGTVRAEEFNSVNEGLFPVLQAVAQGSDRFQGSVARLRAAVIAGRVSSREFFEAFQRGATSLQERASKAALTTSAAFTQLRNALVVYIGEANQTSGASVALGNAIRALANNLQTIIPALTVIGVALGVGYVSNAIRARAATLSLAAAGRGLLGIFGGPLGIAITAVTFALGSLAISSAEAEAAISGLEGGVEQAQLKLEEARDRAQRAGVAVNEMRVQTAGAHPVMLSIAGALDTAAQAARNYANSARAAAIASAQLRLVQTREQLAGLERIQGRRQSIGGVVGRNPAVIGFLSMFGPSSERVDAGINAGRTQLAAIQEELRLLQQTPESAFRTTPPSAARTGKKGHGREDHERERALREEHEYQSELRRFRMESLRAEQDRTTDTVTRSHLDEQMLDIEREQYVSDLALKVGLKDLTAARSEQLLAAYDQTQSDRRLAIAFQRNAEIAEENREIDEERYDIQRESLQSVSDLADTAAERRDAENRLLDLAYRHERARLEEIIADEASSRAAVAKARLRLADLENWRSREQQSIDARNMGPLASFLDQLPTTAAKANEALQQVAAEGLQSIEDGLVAALTGTKSLAAAFRDMATSIIADLLRIQIQRLITIPLSNFISGLSMFGGAAGGGGAAAASAGSSFISALGSASALIPRARGGPVIPGRRYMVGENGPEELRMGFGGGVIRPMNDNGIRGNVYNIYPQSPNTGDPRRDRQTMLQNAAIIRDTIARSAKTGH